MSRSILLFVTLVGCTASAGQRARTAGKGVVQVGLEGGAIHNPWSDSIAPLVDVAIRAGISERMDLGARLGSSGIEAQGKVRLTSEDGVVTSTVLLLSRTGGIGARCGESEESFDDCSVDAIWSAHLPLLVDLPTGPRSAIVLGPAVRGSIYQTRQTNPMPRNWLHIGGSVGYALPLTDSITLLPELGVLQPLCCDAPDWVQESTDPRFRLTNLRVALLLGPHPRLSNDP